MKKKKALVVIVMLIVLAVVAIVWLQVNRNSEQQAFVDNLTEIVTDTLTLPWVQWPDIADNIDPARPETMRTALEDYFINKYGDRIAWSTANPLVDNAIQVCVWNMKGETEVTVKSMVVDEWRVQSKTCLFTVTVSAAGREYAISGRAQMSTAGNGQVGYCRLAGEGFNAFIDAGRQRHN